MSVTHRSRRVVLGVLLVASLIAAVGAHQRAPSALEAAPAPTRSVPAPRDPAPASALLPLERLERRAVEAEIRNILGSAGWQAPAPKAVPIRPAKPAPPPRPAAPPLPFSYVGRLEEGADRVVVFLARGERLYLVAEGDVIDGTYAVGALAQGRLRLTYLPLGIEQFLFLGHDA